MHPSDWHTQIYSLGPNEFYIDIAMPFGKANSSRVFCLWTSAWCESFKFHFRNRRPFPIALAVYMDDFFGGPIRTESLAKDFKHAQKMFKDLIAMGKLTNTLMNEKKCVKPARSMDIIGMNFNSKERACFLSQSKAKKYKLRLAVIRKAEAATSKELQKLVGYLVYAAWVMPFGRPFISQISNMINVEKIRKRVRLDSAALAACDVWLLLLGENRGLSFDFILGKLPRLKNEWFVDASSRGYGGVCGTSFFKISHQKLCSFMDSNSSIIFTNIFIAYRELLAVLFAFQVFAKLKPKSYIRLNSDNSNVVSWVNRGRCSKKMGFLLLSAIEFFKYKFGLRIKAFYIKSSHNTSADALSRGRTPFWLAQRGVEIETNVKQIIELIVNPLPFWKSKKKIHPL